MTARLPDTKVCGGSAKVVSRASVEIYVEDYTESLTPARLTYKYNSVCCVY